MDCKDDELYPEFARSHLYATQKWLCVCIAGKSPEEN